uniref:Uncharacterized protein n=1 Tax=Homo sapiens TaxID=9606 RepID=A0A7P0T8K8_HUMAN
MGSQPPLGSPLSREEGEAPPPAPASEGRRRSRRVRLRGSCRHRPSFLGCRELAASAPARPAPASSERCSIFRLRKTTRAQWRLPHFFSSSCWSSRRKAGSVAFWMP